MSPPNLKVPIISVVCAESVFFEIIIQTTVFEDSPIRQMTSPFVSVHLVELDK